MIFSNRIIMLAAHSRRIFMQRGLSVDEVEKIVEDFYNDLPALQQIHCKIFENEEEAFGYEYAKQSRETKTRTSGAYFPRDRTIFIPAASNHSEEDLRRTLRHELLGHFGLNTFHTIENRNTLNSIMRHKGAGKEPDNWAKIQNTYPGAGRDTLAEEYFAHICENPAHPDVKISSRLLKLILTSKRHIPSSLDIDGLANYVEQKAAENDLEQKHMPSSNNSSFKLSFDLSNLRSLSALKQGKFQPESAVKKQKLVADLER
jgi:putative DNA primase/helicase